MNIQLQAAALQDDRGRGYGQKPLPVAGDEKLKLSSSGCATHDQAKAFIVTGDEGLKGLLKYSLNFYGMQVLFCQGGAEALAFSTINPYDCIILDCDTPGMDGIDHVRRLREQFEFAVIIGLSKEDRGVPCLQAGMNDFLQRPFSPYRLAMMMNGGDLLLA